MQIWFRRVAASFNKEFKQVEGEVAVHWV